MVIGTSGFVRKRARSQLGVLATAALTAIAVATLMVLATALPPRVAETTFSHTAVLSPENHVVRATSGFDSETWVATNRQVNEALSAAEIPGTTVASIWSSVFTAPQLPDRTNIVVGALTGIEDLATLTDGRWPESGTQRPEVVVHTAALDGLGVSVGDTLIVTPTTGDAQQETFVVGTYQPNDPSDPVWREYGFGVIPGSGSQVTLLGPILAHPGDYLEHLALAAGTSAWTTRIDTDHISFADADEAINGVQTFEATLADLDSGQINITGNVVDHLERSQVAATSARAVLLVIVVMLAVLALWALTFTARLVAARRGAVTALLRARGLEPRRLALWSAYGALAPVLVVVVTAPLLSTVAVEWLTSSGTLAETGAAPMTSAASWAVAILAGLGWMALLIATDLSAGRTMASVALEHARPPRRAAVQRAGIDVLALALAGLGLQQLRRPPGDTPDLVLIAAPAVIVLAGALILIRALPWMGRAASWLTTRLRGFASGLGTMDIARRPLRHGAAAVLLVLALAVSIVTAATNSTWRDFRDDIVSLTEPADARVTAAWGTDPDDLQEAITGTEGIEATAAISRIQATNVVGYEIIAADPEELRAVLREPDDPAIARLLTALESWEGKPPAVLSRSLAEHFGYQSGDMLSLPIGEDGAPVQVVVSGTVDAVPGASSEFALMVDNTGSHVPAQEWWLSWTGADAAAPIADLEGVESIETYAQANDESKNDLTTSAVLSAFTGALGFAAIFLLIGAVVQAVSSFRARADEHAVLRAIGFTGGGTLRAVTIEHVLLLGFAAIAGVGLGAFVSWLTVPHTVGGLAGLPSVPPLELSLPWPLIGALGLALAVVLVIVVIVATTGLRRVDIVRVLRAVED